MKNQKKCIVLVCNDGFLNHALFVCQQLACIKHRDFDIVIASGENLKHSIPENIIFIQEEMDDFTNQLPEIPRLRNFAYWRIPVIQKLSEIYDVILYLDTDIFINDPTQIMDLLCVDMKDYALAAVRDVHQMTRPNRMPQEHKSLNLPSVPYFNSGVLLIQSSQWIIQNYFEKIKYLTKNNIKNLYCHDQSLLNLVTEGHWLELSPTWNWQYSRKNNYISEVFSPILIHFAGPHKLWHTPTQDIPRRYWNAYHNYLFDQKIQGVNTCINDTPYDNDSVKKWGVNLLKNLWYFKQYRNYIIRFSNKNSTIAHPKVFGLFD